MSIDRSHHFAKRVEHFAAMLSEIDIVTVALQTHAASLADCRFAISVLRESVAAGSDYPDSKFYDRQLASTLTQIRFRVWRG